MTDYSDIDLVYLWLDFNDTWLKTATTEMILSAQRAMPGINIIQISDQAARKHPLANSAMVFDKIVDCADFAAFKGYAFAEHALRTERPTIFCDVDLIWNNAGAAEILRGDPTPSIFAQMGSDDESLLPIDSAMVLYRPGFPEFWRRYQHKCDHCKPGFREWWCDQLAFGQMMGEVVPVEFLAGEPQSMPVGPMTCAATHFAAHREWLVPYARLLDGGAPFEALMPGLDEISYETGEDLTDRSSDYNYDEVVHES